MKEFLYKFAFKEILCMFEGKKVLIFDLGGVLIDLHIDRSFSAFIEMGAAPSLLTERNCLINEYMMRFDRGDISTAEMFSYIASQLSPQVCEGLGPLLNGRIQDAWNAMLGDYAPYKFHRINELREHGYRVVMLSNTNDGHWEKIERDFEATMGKPLSAFFDAFYLSYRMRLRKPEPGIFAELLASEGVKPCDCLFFDDSAENCDAARAMGIDSVLMERNAPWSNDLLNE